VSKAFSALSFLIVIIVPILSYDEPKVSLIQTPSFVRLSLAANTTSLCLHIPAREKCHLHSDLCHVKIVDADGAHLTNGEKGEVVISNFVNGDTVLLNYRLGDIGTISDKQCSCGRTLPLLSELDGRIDEIIYLADGGFVHPIAVGGVLNRHPEVLQYQLIQQEPKQFELRIVTADKNAYERVITGITTGLQDLLGASAEIDHGYHEELPREAGGKFRIVISLCKQQEFK